MGKLKFIGMVTTGVETSPYHTTKGINLYSGTLLVGTKPIKGGVGGDPKNIIKAPLILNPLRPVAPHDSC